MQSYLKIYLSLTAAAIAIAGTINVLVDPLWYGKGNRITGENFSFNERVSKTNLLLNSDVQQYDCLILGSSRTTLLRSSSFQNQHCFNYAFSAGSIAEFVEYARFAKEHGLNPTTVYVGVDAFNFSPSPYNTVNPKVVEPQAMLRAYLSLDVLLFSVKTLLQLSPDPRYYNQNFESEVIDHLPEFEPAFYDRQSPSTCDSSKVEYYAQIKNLFPNATVIGYVPPISAWNVVNETYERQVLDCTLAAFYEVSTIFEQLYDFSVPSEVTTAPQKTYDGSHFYPEVHEEVAQVLQGKSNTFGILVNAYSLEDYQQYYKSRVREFLLVEGEGDRWHEAVGSQN